MDDFKRKSEEAKAYIRSNKHLLIEKFACLEKFPPNDRPFSIFMAGSPGAGKTETSKALIKRKLIDKHCRLDSSQGVVRIDADEIREVVPGYNGTNSDIFQAAAVKGVEILFDHVLHQRQSVILDGTFTNYEAARRNIVRSLNRNRVVAIFYIYQDPLKAWTFTKIREKVEGRTVPKDAFIRAFFNARENINKIKQEFGKDIKVYLIEKNYESRFGRLVIDIDDVDKHIKDKYDNKSLSEILC